MITHLSRSRFCLRWPAKRASLSLSESGSNRADAGCHITSNLMTAANVAQGRGYLSAFNPGIGTPWMESATGGRVNGVAYLAL